jgi:hypothetical protein
VRPQDSIWQGCFGYWQNLFIRENLLALGHAAWQGFMTQGHGMVVCEVMITDVKSVNWKSDLVEYTVRFIPELEIPAYLQSFKLESALIDRLLETVQTYQPAQDICLLIHENGQLDINLLQRLAISPPECYQQCQQRWAEFQLDSFRD